MAAGRAFQTYQQAQINTASQRELILMLYGGAIRFLREATGALEEEERERAHQAIIRARRIISELMSTLNRDAGEIAARLFSLYHYIFRLLVEANLEQSPAKTREAIELLSTLKDGWEKLPAATELKEESGQPIAT
jgi:flagellar protein FliS